MNSPFPLSTSNARRVSRAGFLDAESEAALARAWRDQGDEAARDRLVLAHRPLAIAAAVRAGRNGTPNDDLIQQALLGLLKAADRFDPDLGYRFSTYATWWVRAEIQEYAYADWSLVRMPGASTLRRVFFGLRKAEAELRAEGTAPEDMAAALATRFGVEEDKIALVRDRLAGRDASLNQQIGAEGGGAEWQDLLVDPDPDSNAETRVGDQRARGRIAQVLARHLGQLPERERRILLETVVADDQKTLADLGEALSISRERVRQLRERALLNLRKTLDADPEARALLERGEGLSAA